MDHVDRNGLCHQINLYRLPDGDLDHIAFGNGRLGRDQWRAIAQNRPFPDEFGNSSARELRFFWHITGKRLIKTRRRVFPNGDLHNVSGRTGG